VALIAEVDTRRLYARGPVSSMFAWCTEVLHLSEYEAYLRIAVARASREHPILLTMLADGRLHLSGIALLARHLTPENRDQVLERAAGRPHRELKELAAELAPRPDVPARVRKLPPRRVETPAGSPQLGTCQVGSPREAAAACEAASGGLSVRNAAPTGATHPPASERESASILPGTGVSLPAGATPSSQRASVEPLAPARFKVQFTADAEFRDMLERLQALMHSSVPDGDLATVLRVAVKEKIERLEAKRFGTVNRPRKTLAETDTTPKSRGIPAPVRRAVHERDGGRCTYRDEQGQRCSKRHDLEFHHREPFGHGGDHSPDNLALVCATHNTLLAEQVYGKEVMWRHRRRSSSRLPDRTPSLPLAPKRGHG
jgi:hypothetical protein